MDQYQKTSLCISFLSPVLGIICVQTMYLFHYSSEEATGILISSQLISDYYVYYKLAAIELY